MAGKQIVKAHLMRRENTEGIFDGCVVSDRLEIDVCGPDETPKGFPLMLQDRAFDLCELPLVTCLQAISYGRDLVVLPVIVMSRFQHRYLAMRKDSGLTPQTLAGQVMSVRTYSVTTVTWMREILRVQCGLSDTDLKWKAYSGAHLPEFKDPAHVERFMLGERSPEDVVADGDAALTVLNTPVKHPMLTTVFADPESAAREWYAKTNTVQVNHVMALDGEFARANPDSVRELYRMFVAARLQAEGRELGLDVLPYGVDQLEQPVRYLMDAAHRQGVIPAPMEYKDLFNDVTFSLNGAGA